MVDQLLWIDLLIKAACGLLLLSIPRILIAITGLPRSDQAFYPRVLGALLLGIALALYVEGSNRAQSNGLGIGGASAINILSAITLLVLLIVPRPTTTLRGRMILWGLAGIMLVLGLAQLLFAT